VEVNLVSLRHAILTALLEVPSTGLSLTRRFDRSIGYFWQATHQQVYRETAKLEAEALIRAVPQATPARGNPKTYEVTDEGRAELIRWVGDSEPPKPGRDALLVRLRAASVVGPGPLVDQMREHHEFHSARHAEYLAVAARDFADRELDDVARMQYLILRAGIGLEEFWTAWLQDAITELSQGAGSRKAAGAATAG
jgi:DNA-binding PadR family transcriptional regulator